MNEAKQELPSDRRGWSFWVTFGGFAVVALATVLVYGWTLAYFTGNSFDKSGQFGDSFAPLNTLFAGLAFAAVAASLRIQRHQLDMQNEALRLTRQELKQSLEEQQRLVRASELDHITRERPRVLAWLSQTDTATWYLTIRNDGVGVANTLGLSLDRNVGFRGYKLDNARSYLNELPIFSGRKFVLAPSQELSYLLEPYANQVDGEETFSLGATYSDSAEHKFSETFELDFAFATGRAIIRDRNDLGIIAGKLDQMLSHDRSTKRVL